MKKPSIFKALKYSFLTSAFLLTNVSSALAIDVIIPWTTSGAVGTPDKPTMVKYNYAGPEVEMADDATGQVRLFYQVHDADSLVSILALDGWKMTARYLDNGPDARITIRLREMDLDTGEFTNIFKIDSDDYAADELYQTQNKDFELGCFSSYSFDFSNHAYYVVVKLEKTGLAGQAGIAGMKIEPTNCLL